MQNLLPCHRCKSTNITIGYYGQPASSLFLVCECGLQSKNIFQGTASGMINISETYKLLVKWWNDRV